MNYALNYFPTHRTLQSKGFLQAWKRRCSERNLVEEVIAETEPYFEIILHK